MKSLFGLAGSWEMLEKHEKEMDVLIRLKELLSDNGQDPLLGDVYNSMGLVEFRLGNYQKAIDNFRRAVDIYRLSGMGSESSLSNIAFCYQNMDERSQSEYYFEQALTESRRSGNLSEESRIEHILAVINLNSGDLYHAGYYSEAAIASAKESGNLNALQLAYETYSHALESGNDFVRALEYYEKFLSLRDSLALEQKIAAQERERRRFEIGSFEQQLRLGLAGEEIKDLALRNLRIEAEKRENDLKLVERDRELERSEKERLQQSIDLDRERYNRILKENEVKTLEQERAVQELELIQRENAERELLREKRLLESEARQQELELANELEAKKRIKWMVGLLVIIALTILYNLINSKRKNQVLTARKKEIEQINADLERTNQEVLDRNRQIVEQSEIIEEKNQSITDSIEYASRIQSAVLPPLDFLSDWGIDNFIMFRPKDIVSGDFYWGQEVGNWLAFAAADCTGHGVPGAFMSMLGTAYLNDIVNSREFTTAAEILNMLRDEVVQSLKQRGVEGETQDGMDIAFCLYNRDTRELHFSGANNPLYLFRNGNFEKVEADKMPIGIHRLLDRTFTDRVINIEKEDVIYLFSDGYADQFGGESGKKFKYRAFREMLQELHGLPMERQKQLIEERFSNWKGRHEQVDDVLVIGVRFG
ncbi:MAG: SpoIIE family protein phosphatase [Bacteroidales bacterium]